MATPRRKSAAFSLIEVLLVVALMAIVVGLVIPNSNSGIHDQLHSAARIVAGDLAYARSLAVTHGSTYQVTLDIPGNRYVLRHSGANSGLDRLPATPFGNPGDPADQYVVRLADFPRLGPTVQLAGAASFGSGKPSVSDLEFGSLGETTRSGATVLWLAAGEGPARRYITLRVNPVTGLATIGAFSAQGPPNGIGVGVGVGVGQGFP